MGIWSTILSLLSYCLYIPLQMSKLTHYHFDIINTSWMKLNVETDFFLGTQTKHVGKPSEYPELSDEYDLDFKSNSWFKVNYDILNEFIGSQIIEVTWFEVMPLAIQTYTEQAESLPEMILNFDFKNMFDFLAYVRLFYYFDFLSLKLYHVQYPQFCSVDLLTLIETKKFIECGYGDMTSLSKNDT